MYPYNSMYTPRWRTCIVAMLVVLWFIAWPTCVDALDRMTIGSKTVQFPLSEYRTNGTHYITSASTITPFLSAQNMILCVLSNDGPVDTPIYMRTTHGVAIGTCTIDTRIRNHVILRPSRCQVDLPHIQYDLGLYHSPLYDIRTIHITE